MKLSIVILTWNSEKYIRGCLDSLIISIQGINSEIIVVDNGSSDESVSILENEYPNIMLLKNIVNLGVAPARNQGISIARGEYVMILDIDTHIYPESINEMLNLMERDKNIAICAPKLIFSDGIVQKSCRKFPLVHMKLLRRIDRDWAKKILESENYTDKINGTEPFEVDYVIGACQLIRKSSIDKIGLLDENIFYGPEDVDYCLRMWLNGYRVFYIPCVKVIHYEQRITKRKILSKVTLKHVIALFYYFKKYKYYFSREGIYKKINRAKSNSNNF